MVRNFISASKSQVLGPIVHGPPALGLAILRIRAGASTKGLQGTDKVVDAVDNRFAGLAGPCGGVQVVELGSRAGGPCFRSPD